MMRHHICDDTRSQNMKNIKYLKKYLIYIKINYLKVFFRGGYSLSYMYL